MTPDDPRHGTPRGRRAHLAAGQDVCEPCATANALYQRRYRKNRALYGDRLLPALGSARRIQALMRLGWSAPAIATRIGMHPKQVWWTTTQRDVTRAVAERIAEAYEAMSMTLPPTDTKSQRISAAQTRNHAERNGYAPPLAWDNIDDPDEQPTNWHYKPVSRAEALAELLERGADIHEACRALHVSRDALEKWCARNGRMADLHALVAREDGTTSTIVARENAMRRWAGEVA